MKYRVHIMYKGARCAEREAGHLTGFCDDEESGVIEALGRVNRFSVTAKPYTILNAIIEIPYIGKEPI